jgi:hypothetical protein
MEPTARVLLLLSRKELQMQVIHVLTALGVTSESVDRFRYREMQDASPPTQALWPQGRAFVLGLDFAKQDDITASLCSVPWTLLVIPDAQQLRGERERAVQKIVTSSPHARLLLLTLPGVENLPTLGIRPWTESTVRLRDAVDNDGRRILELPPLQVRVIELQLDAVEQRLKNAVAEIMQLFRRDNGTQSALSAIFESSLRSSLPALEQVVRRLRNQLVHGKADIAHLSNEQDDESDADDLPSIPQADVGRVLAALDTCLAELELLATDAKLKALTHLLMEAKTRGDVPRSMCILTTYRATLCYLQTALEELGFAPYVLHGALPFEERFQAVHGFQEHGGILLATTALMTGGLSMPQADSLVMYDLPHSQIMLQQILGCFQRFGRKTPLRITVLNDGEANEVLRLIDSATRVDRS